MKRTILFFIMLLSLAILSNNHSRAQVKWIVGGNMGLAIATGGGGSSTGFTFGPMAEVLFNKNAAVGSEFDITTTTGTPITWASYFKYYFTIPGSRIKPYADAGFGLVFVTGGPYVFIPFGGGANFPVSKNLYVSADLTLGPQFVSVGTGPFSQSFTFFNIIFRGGIRYEIP